MTNIIAANPLTVPQHVDPVAPIHELLNIAHSRPFSMLFGNYSWALGAAGGLTLIWAIYVIAGRRRGLEYRYALPLAVALITAGFLNVLSEVEQPSRLIYGYIFGWQYWATAMIKYGIILLPLYLAMCWWLSFQAMDRALLGKTIERMRPSLRFLADFFSLWSRHYSVMETPGPRRWTLVVLIFLSLFAPMYSGMFLMNEHGVAIWNSPAQPLIFLFTAAAKGAMLMLVVVPIMAWLAVGRKPRVVVDPLRWGAAICIALAAALWFGWLWWMGRFGSIEELRAAQLFMGPYSGYVLWQWIVPGIIVPLVLLVTPLGRHLWAQSIAAIGIFWGGYSVRVLILMGGEALIRSGAGYQAFTPSKQVLLYTGFSVLAAIGVLTALLLLLPDKRAAELDASNK